MRPLQGRFVALALTALTLARAWPNTPKLWAIIIVDGVALILIWLPGRIDAMSFGTYMRGGPVTSHTPNWMISTFGWGLLMVIGVLIYRNGHLL